MDCRGKNNIGASEKLDSKDQSLTSSNTGHGGFDQDIVFKRKDLALILFYHFEGLVHDWARRMASAGDPDQEKAGSISDGNSPRSIKLSTSNEGSAVILKPVSR